MKLQIKSMDYSSALTAATWRYPEPYQVYNMDSDEDCLKEMLGGAFYAVYQGNIMVGFYCFGASARIPWADKNDLYPHGFIDIGLAMRPDLTGKGLGFDFFCQGLMFARNSFAYTPIRLTVACFNNRAQKVYQRAGFKKVGQFAVPGGAEFIIMVQQSQGAV